MKARLRMLVLCLLPSMTTPLPAATLAIADEEEVCYSTSDYSFGLGITGIQHPRMLADAYISRSNTQWLVCGGGLQAELWIEEYGNAVIAQNHPSSTFTQSFTERMVDRYGTFYARSKHWWIAGQLWYAVAGVPEPRNGNGTIDNGSELFGNFTPAYRAGGHPTTLNGFEALKFAENERGKELIYTRDPI